MDLSAMNGQSGDRGHASPAGEPAPRRDQPAPFARLKQRSEFLAVAKGARMHEPAFTLQAIARDPGEPTRRFGLTVTKKTGNSVERNRIRRRLREALRASGVARGDTPDGRARDYVIVARRDVLSRDFAGLTHDMTQAVKRIDKKLAAPRGPSRPRSSAST